MSTGIARREVRRSRRSAPEAAREVANARAEHGGGQKVCTSADELALEVPAVDAARRGIRQMRRRGAPVSCAGHNVEVVCLLEAVVESEGKI